MGRKGGAKEIGREIVDGSTSKVLVDPVHDSSQHVECRVSGQSGQRVELASSVTGRHARGRKIVDPVHDFTTLLQLFFHPLYFC